MATPQEQRLIMDDAAARRERQKAQPRPERVTHEWIEVGKPRPITSFPKKFAETLEHEQRIKICCRHPDENAVCRVYKTNPELQHPDMFVATCQRCGCNHYRLLVGEAA